MVKRVFTIAAASTALVGVLAACDVQQTDWNNRYYAVSSGCLAPGGGATLVNGTGVFSYPSPYRPGQVGHTRITVEKILYGDFTHDGIQDVAVLLGCNDNDGGNGSGTEIQIFTRDAKPVARLTQPDRYGSGNPFGSQFNRWNIGVSHNVLYTGAYGYKPGDPHCCPSAYEVYRWDWNGHGFTPVDVNSRYP